MHNLMAEAIYYIDMLNLRELSEGLLVTVSLNRLVKKKEKKKKFIFCVW